MNGNILRRRVAGGKRVIFYNYISHKTAGSNITFDSGIHITGTMTFSVKSVWTNTASTLAVHCWRPGYDYTRDPLFYIERHFRDSGSYNLCLFTKTSVILRDQVGSTHVVEYTGTKLVVDNVDFITGVTQQEFVPNSTLVASGPKIYNAKIYDNGVLVHDFKPASIGESCGMYDVITKTLVTVTNSVGNN